MLTKRGFTLVELLIALVMMGIVSAAIYQLLVNNERIYHQQTQRIELNDNLRSAIAILPTDLRELDASDGDIVEMTDSSITYKAMRNLYLTCGQANGNLLYLDTTLIGLRKVDATYDSLLVFADSQSMLTRDDRWIHLDISAAVSAGNQCPGSRPSVNVAIQPAISLGDSVVAGSPVRGFELVIMRRYTDASGVTWLGQQRYAKGSGWSAVQPVVGPLEPRGLRFVYYAQDGTVTADRTKVARISIVVIGHTSKPVRLNDGSTGYLADSLVTQVALRNNR